MSAAQERQHVRQWANRQHHAANVRTLWTIIFGIGVLSGLALYFQQVTQ
jgi:hypothetical protein